jgi:Domain of unknown function (DUF4405)
MKISRTDWKYIVDTLMALCLLGIVLIGLLLGFVIPEGRLAPGQSKYFLGVHRHQWGDVHLCLSLAFTALVVVHLGLAWRWVKGKADSLFGKAWKAVVGLTVLAAVLVPILFWVVLSKNDPAYAEFGEGHGRQEERVAREKRSGRAPLSKAEAEAAVRAPAEAVITGKMTLRQVEQATGVPAKDIAALLGLPADVSFDETLGRLRQAYGFEMHALSDAVAELLKAKRPPLAPLSPT